MDVKQIGRERWMLVRSPAGKKVDAIRPALRALLEAGAKGIWIAPAGDFGFVKVVPGRLAKRLPAKPSATYEATLSDVKDGHTYGLVKGASYVVTLKDEQQQEPSAPTDNYVFVPMAVEDEDELADLQLTDDTLEELREARQSVGNADIAGSHGKRLSVAELRTAGWDGASSS